jgi:Short-chain alcohol dehydrogenase of unknown specificity
MDVTNDISVREAIGGIIAEVGAINILINNAGIMYLGITEAFSIAQANEQMEANYYGAIRTMQAVLPSMRKAGNGLIINTTSLVGRISPPFFSTYTASKHALEGYAQGCDTKYHHLVLISLWLNLAHLEPAFSIG